MSRSFAALETAEDVKDNGYEGFKFFGRECHAPPQLSRRFRSSRKLGSALLRLLGRAQIPVEDLFAGPEHHARPCMDMFKRLAQIAKPVRCAHDVWVYH